MDNQQISEQISIVSIAEAWEKKTNDGIKTLLKQYCENILICINSSFDTYFRKLYQKSSGDKDIYIKDNLIIIKNIFLGSYVKNKNDKRRTTYYLKDGDLDYIKTEIMKKFIDVQDVYFYILKDINGYNIKEIKLKADKIIKIVETVSKPEDTFKEIIGHKYRLFRYLAETNMVDKQCKLEMNIPENEIELIKNKFTSDGYLVRRSSNSVDDKEIQYLHIRRNSTITPGEPDEPGKSYIRNSDIINTNAIDDSKNITDTIDDSKDITDTIDNSKDITDTIDDSKDIIDVSFDLSDTGDIDFSKHD